MDGFIAIGIMFLVAIALAYLCGLRDGYQEGAIDRKIRTRRIIDSKIQGTAFKFPERIADHDS